MRKYLILILFIFLLVSCSKSINKSEPINLLFKVISYNNIPIENKPEGLIIPTEIKLINYIKGEILYASVRFPKIGWFISEAVFNSPNEIYIELNGYGANITLTNLIITENQISGEYYWGYSEDERSEFVAVIEYIF